jgi:hypothetical protein
MTFTVIYHAISLTVLYIVYWVFILTSQLFNIICITLINESRRIMIQAIYVKWIWKEMRIYNCQDLDFQCRGLFFVFRLWFCFSQNLETWFVRSLARLILRPITWYNWLKAGTKMWRGYSNLPLLYWISNGNTYINKR